MPNGYHLLNDQHIVFILSRFDWHESEDGPNQTPQLRWLMTQLLNDFQPLEDLVIDLPWARKALENEIVVMLRSHGRTTDD